MGSSFSIVNNTEETVWVRVTIHKKLLLRILRVFICLGQCILSALVNNSNAPTGGGSGAQQPSGPSTASNTQAGQRAANATNQPTDLEIAEKAIDFVGNQMDKNEAQLTQDGGEFKRVEAGDKYTFKGSLSLLMKASVSYDAGQNVQTRNCFTGSTHKSERLYPVRKYFPRSETNSQSQQTDVLENMHIENPPPINPPLENTSVVNSPPEDTPVVNSSPENTSVVNSPPENTSVVNSPPEDTSGYEKQDLHAQQTTKLQKLQVEVTNGKPTNRTLTI